MSTTREDLLDQLADAKSSTEVELLVEKIRKIDEINHRS
jgi:hypothetical protein